MVRYFFLGKGGVGKTTLAILKALALAGQGKRVRLISLDQAHNLSDYLPQNPTQFLPDFKFFEPSTERFVKQFVHQQEELLRQNYRYLTALNLEHHFHILKYAPGLEEYGLLLTYLHFLKQEQKADVLIFDMPPTALALKFFALPFVSLLWLENLTKLRHEILAKKEIISRVKFGKKEMETDAVKNNLEQQLHDYQKLTTQFKDLDLCRIVLVTHPDPVALAESTRIAKHLANLQITIHQLWVNRVSQEKVMLPSELAQFNLKQVHIKKASETLLGYQAFNNFVKEISQELIQ